MGPVIGSIFLYVLVPLPPLLAQFIINQRVDIAALTVTAVRVSDFIGATPQLRTDSGSRTKILVIPRAEEIQWAQGWIHRVQG